MSSVSIAGNFLGGAWVSPAGIHNCGTLRVINPGDLSAGPLAEYDWSRSFVDLAVVHARRAFPSWRKMPWDEREAILQGAQRGIEARREELARSIALEMGKPIADARAEVTVMVKKFDITLPDAKALLTPHPHPDDHTIIVRGEPRGVVAVIGPFNFPGHLVNGMVLPALATGNTVVLKPASITPGVWKIMTEIFQEAGLPHGVLNYVLGDWSVGQLMAEHPDIDLLLFTGGVKAGRAIKRAAVETRKEITLEMGGQGVALVLEDADVQKALDHIVKGATVRGGQNCNGTRHVVVVGGNRRAEEMKEAIRERFGRIRVGYQLDDGIDYGPLATDPATGFRRDLNAILVRRDLSVILARGGEILFEGSLPSGLPRGYYVGPILYYCPKNVFDPDDIHEVFGPALGLTVVSSVEQGLELMNSRGLRLSCAIHGADVAYASALAMDARWGQTIINGPTVGASSFTDFAGLGEATYGGSGGRAMTEHTITRVNIIRGK